MYSLRIKVEKYSLMLLSTGKLYIPQRKSYTDTTKTIKISIFEIVRE
jgi:hypothetical protein